MNELDEYQGTERLLSSRRIYDGRILNLRVDEIETKGGRRTTREVVEHHSAVGVLALTGRNSVLLVRQFRYAAGEETLEICAGLVEKGEDPKNAATREMREELGWFPGVLREIGRFYASPGFCTELLTLFLAEDLSASSLPQDDDEDVSAVEVPYEEVPQLLAKGAVRDAKTFAALSWLMAWKGLGACFK
ncbi:MAG: NUDIX hydrolase [Synergistaceae bacterium]|jgi:ADP-ribose pyrophosphatase|nr:NUDIX hydrolase [Synergistaceae bacterium]